MVLIKSEGYIIIWESLVRYITAPLAIDCSIIGKVILYQYLGVFATLFKSSVKRCNFKVTQSHGDLGQVLLFKIPAKTLDSLETTL